MTIASVYQRPLKELDLEGSTQDRSEDLWLCLRFSYLAMNCFDTRLTDPALAAITHQQQIWQSTDAARQSGIRVGQSLSHALMLCPRLELIERKLSKETRKLEALSDWAYRFTSHVHVYDEHTLLLEIGHSLGLFKGLKHLQHLISHGLNTLGVDVEFGLARTPKAAQLLSFSEQDTWSISSIQHKLLQAQVSNLAVDKKILAKLQHCGFTRLADITEIPSAELGARFGHSFIDYLDRLRGSTLDPQVLTTPPETFTTRIDFAEPIRNRTWIEQQINRLLKDLVSFVTDRNLVCRSFTWQFYADNNSLLKAITIKLASSNTDFNSFKSLTELQFANASMQWEFSSIELSSNTLLQRQQFHSDLFNPQADQEGLGQLLEKLSNRLGDQALLKVSAQPEQLPELACHSHAIDHGCTPIDRSQAHRKDARLKDEPLWLLESPKKLEQQGDRPILDGILQLIHGPHRVTSHWWATLQSRDYYIARQNNGRLLWIYCQRSQGNWYLHGLFA